MMETLVTLPVQATLNKITTLLVPFVLAMNVVMAAVLYVVLGNDSQLPSEIHLLVPLAPVVMSLPACGVLLFAAPPAAVSVSRFSVKVAPLPVLGFTRGVEQNYNMSDFASIGLAASTARPNAVPKVTLRGKPGHADVRFDAPTGMDKRDYVRQLGAALDLKVNDNA